MILCLPGGRLVPVVATTADADGFRNMWPGQPRSILAGDIAKAMQQLNEDAKLERWHPMRYLVVTPPTVRRAWDWLDWRGRLHLRDWIDAAPISRTEAWDWPKTPTPTTAAQRGERQEGSP